MCNLTEKKNHSYTDTRIRSFLMITIEISYVTAAAKIHSVRTWYLEYEHEHILSSSLLYHNDVHVKTSFPARSIETELCKPGEACSNYNHNDFIETYSVTVTTRRTYACYNIIRFVLLFTF